MVFNAFRSRQFLCFLNRIISMIFTWILQKNIKIRISSLNFIRRRTTNKTNPTKRDQNTITKINAAKNVDILNIFGKTSFKKSIQQFSGSFDPHSLVLNHTDKIDLRRGDKCVTLSNFSVYCTWKNIKKSYGNNKFKISRATWDEEFELFDGSYSVSDIQDYFQYIIKKQETFIDKSLIQIQDRMTFKTKTLYCLELLTPETMGLVSGSTERKITKDKINENMPQLNLMK